MDMTVVLGLHKFNLLTTIDHHGPSMYSGHYTTTINCCKKTPIILLQRQQNYAVQLVFDFYAGPSARGRQLYCRA